MTELKKLDTYNEINWKDLIADLLLKSGKSIVVDPENWNLETHGYSEIYKMWKDAKFNPESIKWINYYPGVDFSKDIIEKLSNHLNIKVHRAWISRINPGFFAPWHWDIDDAEEEYKKKGEIKRYSCFISPCSMGHIFILGNDYLYNQKEGALVQWNNYREWHAGINGGLTPKFMLHIIGY